MNNDLTIVPVTSQEMFQRCVDFMVATNHTDKLTTTEGANYYAVMKDDAIIAVGKYGSLPVLAMYFEPDATGLQTLRAFAAIRHALQFIGSNPIVYVDNDSPLAPWAEKFVKCLTTNGHYYRID